MDAMAMVQSPEKDTGIKQVDGGQNGSKFMKTFYRHFRNEKEFRSNFINSVIILMACISLGWQDVQVGSSLLDLQIIVGTSLEKLSAIFTASNVGYIAGSFVTGFLFGKVHTNLIMFVSCLGSSSMSVAIPWCSIYELMIFVFFVRGFANGMQNTSSNAMLLRAWGVHHKYYIQALHFCYGFGGILSPLVTAPFLLPDKSLNNSKPDGLNSSTEQKTVLSHDFNMANISNQSSEATYNFSADESKLYFAYLITGILYFIAAVLFIVSFLASRKEMYHSKQIENDNSKSLTLTWKIVSLTNMIILMLMQVSIEVVSRTFLATFCVKHLNWTKKAGAYATSVFSASFSIGRFIDIFAVKLFKPSNLLIIYSVILTFALTGFLFGSIYFFDIGIWICVAVSGFAMSVTFPSILTWTEDDFVQITGKIASLFIISSAASSMVTPPLLGLLMEGVTYMFFCYIPLGECAVVIACYVIGVYLSRKIKRLRVLRSLQDSDSFQEPH